jgi:hypothetical protein
LQVVISTKTRHFNTAFVLRERVQSFRAGRGGATISPSSKGLLFATLRPCRVKLSVRNDRHLPALGRATAGQSLLVTDGSGHDVVGISGTGYGHWPTIDRKK